MRVNKELKEEAESLDVNLREVIEKALKERIEIEKRGLLKNF